jgi:hypothetical protein
MAHHRRRANGRRTIRPPQLEALEDRFLPSTVTWINPAGGDWDTPSNWSTGQVPGAGDSVVIDLGSQNGFTVSHSASVADAVTSISSQDAIRISNGSLSYAADSLIAANLTISGGTLEGAGNLTVSGQFTWNGGTLSGTGIATITAAGGAALDGGPNPGAAVTLYGYRLLIPAGQSAVLTDAADLEAGSVLDNRGTLNVSSGPSGYGTLRSGDGTGVLVNEGVIHTAGNCSLVVSATSPGAIVVDGGSLTLGTVDVTPPGRRRG